MRIKKNYILIAVLVATSMQVGAVTYGKMYKGASAGAGSAAPGAMYSLAGNGQATVTATGNGLFGGGSVSPSTGAYSNIGSSNISFGGSATVGGIMTPTSRIGSTASGSGSGSAGGGGMFGSAASNGATRSAGTGAMMSSGYTSAGTFGSPFRGVSLLSDDEEEEEEEEGETTDSGLIIDGPGSNGLGELGPVGDAFLPLMMIALLYTAFLYKRKKKSAVAE